MTEPFTASSTLTDFDSPPPRSTMRGDLLWAYVASGSRIISWAAVSSIVYRRGGAAEFAMLAMVRGTIGILNYTAVGVAPAMVRVLAEARNNTPPAPVLPVEGGNLLDYQTTPPPSREQVIYASGIALALLSLVVGLVLTGIYAHYFDSWHRVPVRLKFVMPMVVLCIGFGTLLRLFSDVPGAVLQTRGMIGRDNQFLAITEAVWLALVFMTARHDALIKASLGYAMSSMILAFLRSVAAAAGAAPFRRQMHVDWEVVRRLLTLGSLVLVAQLADYLYAPTDYILINHFLATTDVAAYAPAVQIDAGLLTLVTALSAVLLPKAALAHAAGSIGVVRHYYLRGTLASFIVLSAAGLLVWLGAPWILKVWLGKDPGTTFILPLVLVHTVIGGSSAVGRSILLAMGKFKPFTASVLIAGAANVVASYCFVRYLHWGLQGIVLGTIVAVVARCVLWMPWYVMRTLEREMTARS